MKEYTALAVLSAVITGFIDHVSGIRLLRRKRFYLFLLVILSFKLLVNGYLTRQGVFLYNPDMVSGIRVGSIPFEDFLFGFSMVLTTILSWEFFKKK
jgi:lycopene cyclase domain-containing protein